MSLVCTVSMLCERTHSICTRTHSILHTEWSHVSSLHCFNVIERTHSICKRTHSILHTELSHVSSLHCFNVKDVEVSACVKSGRKGPLSAKETYLYGKRDLFIQQTRPSVRVSKEASLFVGPKRPLLLPYTNRSLLPYK
jgi:hypothetical protein